MLWTPVCARLANWRSEVLKCWAFETGMHDPFYHWHNFLSHILCNQWQTHFKHIHWIKGQITVTYMLTLPTGRGPWIAVQYTLPCILCCQGSSRSIVMMEWDKIWAVNKKVGYPCVNSLETESRKQIMCVIHVSKIIIILWLI